jgi:hypothetical protein
LTLSEKLLKDRKIVEAQKSVKDKQINKQINKTKTDTVAPGTKKL